MATSVVPAVIDYLVTTFTAAATIGGATPPVYVFDGPLLTALTEQNNLFIGLDDPEAVGARKAADSTSTWLGSQLGQKVRDETITIFCAADGWSGQPPPANNVQTARNLAYAITAAVENLIRQDLTLGGNVPVPGNAAVSTMGLTQEQTGKGVIARVPFVITARTRI